MSQLLISKLDARKISALILPEPKSGDDNRKSVVELLPNSDVFPLHFCLRDLWTFRNPQSLTD